jgi:hypothetical protein
VCDAAEVAEIGWFAPDALPSELAFPNHVPAVLRAWRDSFELAARAGERLVGARPRQPERTV